MSWENEPMVPLRALANPLRLRIVSLLTGTALSATEVADELGIAHASASYHLRQLAAASYLTRVDDDAPSTGRGQPRRRYRYDPSSALRLDRDGRQLVFEAMVSDLRRRTGESTSRRTSADAEVWLDPGVWDEVCRLVDEAVGLVHAKARAPHAEGTVKVSFTALLLELAA
jgi:DNA-binding transcriptional ArsR family regulator